MLVNLVHTIQHLCAFAPRSVHAMCPRCSALICLVAASSNIYWASVSARCSDAGEDWAQSGSVLPKQDPEGRKGSTPTYMPDMECATYAESVYQMDRSLSARLASRSTCLDLFRSFQSGELPYDSSAKTSKGSSTSTPVSGRSSINFREDQGSRATVAVVLSTTGEQGVLVRFIVGYLVGQLIASLVQILWCCTFLLPHQ